MNAAVQRLEAVPGRRVVTVSDVHGNLPLLKGLLETVSLCGEDLLLLVGDIVEKGRRASRRCATCWTCAAACPWPG